MVDEAIKGIFRETVQLARIRYDELDRLTAHGLRPLPKDYWDIANSDLVTE